MTAGNRGRIDSVINNPCGAVPAVILSAVAGVNSHFAQLYVKISIS